MLDSFHFHLLFTSSSPPINHRPRSIFVVAVACVGASSASVHSFAIWRHCIDVDQAVKARHCSDSFRAGYTVACSSCIVGQSDETVCRLGVADVGMTSNSNGSWLGGPKKLWSSLTTEVSNIFSEPQHASNKYDGTHNTFI